MVNGFCNCLLHIAHCLLSEVFNLKSKIVNKNRTNH